MNTWGLIAASSGGFLFLDVLLLLSLRRAVSKIRTQWIARCRDRRQELTADAAMNRLEQSLRGSFPFIILQRMTPVAPLLGVLMTVLGMYFGQAIKLDPSDPALTIASMRPLYLGVAAGAGLAIVHQLLVLSASTAMVSKSRRLAAEQFDALGTDPAVHAVGEFTTSLRELTRSLESRFTESLREVEGRVQTMGDGLQTLLSNVANMKDQWREVSSEFSAEMTAATQSLVSTLNQATEGLSGINSAAVSTATSLSSWVSALDATKTDMVGLLSDLQRSVGVVQRRAKAMANAGRAAELTREAITKESKEVASLLGDAAKSTTALISQVASEVNGLSELSKSHSGLAAELVKSSKAAAEATAAHNASFLKRMSEADAAAAQLSKTAASITQLDQTLATIVPKLAAAVAEAATIKKSAEVAAHAEATDRAVQLLTQAADTLAAIGESWKGAISEIAASVPNTPKSAVSVPPLDLPGLAMTNDALKALLQSVKSLEGRLKALETTLADLPERIENTRAHPEVRGDPAQSSTAIATKKPRQWFGFFRRNGG